MKCRSLAGKAEKKEKQGAYTKDQHYQAPLQFLLRFAFNLLKLRKVMFARMHSAGDEVTLTYIPEDDMLRSTSYRRKLLEETKYFKCMCER